MIKNDSGDAAWKFSTSDKVIIRVVAYKKEAGEEGTMASLLSGALCY